MDRSKQPLSKEEQALVNTFNRGLEKFIEEQSPVLSVRVIVSALLTHALVMVCEMRIPKGEALRWVQGCLETVYREVASNHDPISGRQ